MYDTHAEVAQAARKAFEGAFSTEEKRRRVFHHCQAECLELLTANLRHTEQSLHDELGIAASGAVGDKNVALERQDRYVRVIVASLGALAELLRACSLPVPAASASSTAKPSAGTAAALDPSSVETLLSVGSACALWPRLAAKQPPLIRRAAAECLAVMLHPPLRESLDGCCAGGSMASSSTRGPVLGALADAAVPAAVAALLVCGFAATGGAACWEGLVASKALWPQLTSAVQRGAPLRDGSFLKKLPALLDSFPTSIWSPGKAEGLLKGLLEAFHLPRGAAPPAAVSRGLWRHYLLVTQSADDAGTPVEASWRWGPLQLYLCGPDSMGSGDAPGGDNSEGSFRPPCRIPEAALEELPAVLQEEMPRLLKSAAGSQLLEELQRATPTIREAREKIGDLAMWWRWLAILRSVLNGPVTSGSEAASPLHAQAISLLGRQFSELILAVLTVLKASECGREAALRQVVPLVEALGALVAVDNFVQEKAWSCGDDGALAKELPRPAEEQLAACAYEKWPEDLTVIAWPLLPMLQTIFLADAGGKASRSVGAALLSPLLKAGLQRCTDSALADHVRSLVLGVLFAAASADSDESRIAVLHSAAVQLAVETLPEELRLWESGQLQDEVAMLTKRVVGGDDHGSAALRLALKPGAMPSPAAEACIEELVEAMRRSAAGEGRSQAEQQYEALRLASIVGAVLDGGSDEAEASRRLASKTPVCIAMLRALVATAGTDSETEAVAAAWAELPSLLGCLDLKVVCETLGPVPEEFAKLSAWVRCLQVAGEAHNVPITSLCRDCRPSGSLQLQGAVARQQLQCHAKATAEIIHLVGCDQFALEKKGLREDAAAMLFEFLVAGAALPLAAPASADVWAWLASSTSDVRSQFAGFIVDCALKEGADWWVDRGETIPKVEASKKADVTSSDLLGVGIVEETLRRMWISASDTCGLKDFVRRTTDMLPVESPSWGRVYVSVVQRCIDLQHGFQVSDEDSDATCALNARNHWRQVLHVAAADGSLSASLLQAAAAAERWALAAFASSDEASPTAVTEETEAASEDGPLIQEVSADEHAPATTGKESGGQSAEEDVDVAIIETHEKLLRWAQKVGTVESGDAFATFTAAIWPALSLAGEGMSAQSKTVTRMNRHVTELLSDAKTSDRTPVSPGALQLAAVLCSTSVWPASSWPLVLQAIGRAAELVKEFVNTIDGDLGDVGETTILDVMPAVASAFTGEVAMATASVLKYVPEASVDAVVSLLQTPDARIQAAAAVRLSKHVWLPKERTAVKEGDALLMLDDLLMQDSSGNADAAGETGQGKKPSNCGDVAWHALHSLLGLPLTNLLWSVEDALEDFTEWVASAHADTASNQQSFVEQ
eukprot:TRINITY_DN38222_c0_g1_i2.p1 TRINITY_DN38222_c0_g1~~TRINITY_DN38222_c0_g1_i2.p1  ORF type:complete len:1552 (+),score=346.58 TRINITY_DN38222_c0_g1_i2:579-4658(+)